MSDNRDQSEPAQDEQDQGLPPAIWISVLVAVTLLVLLFLMKRS
jgi:hypothetical protein